MTKFYHFCTEVLLFLLALEKLSKLMEITVLQ